MKINYKSDFELDYTLLDEHGQPTTPPDFPWKLVLSVGNPLKPYVGQCGCANGRNFVAEYDGENYHNCVVQNDVIRVFVDNHGLPCGQLWATFITYTPNPDFPDGDRRVYTPQATDTFLVAEAGDDPTPAQIQYTANYVVFEHEYTAGQGITIEDDVISATGESYTAGEGITIADGEISVSEGLRGQVADNHSDIVQAQCDIQSQGDRITAVEGSIADLTVTDPALRQSDATTIGEIGKVVKVGLTGVGGVISADIIEAKKIINGPVNSYALPDSDEEVKQNADDVIAMRSELAPIAEDVNELTTNYDTIVNALNQEITELIAGKAMIAEALTDRGYPTQPTDSSASMAQKITDMAYDAGWLAQLGYDEDNDGGIKAAVAYSKAIKDGWNPSAITSIYQGDMGVVFFPMVDTSQYVSFYNMFQGCANLTFVPTLNTSSVTTFQMCFNNCASLRIFPQFDMSEATNLSNLASNCNYLRRVPKLNTSKVTNFDASFGVNSTYYTRNLIVEEVDMGAATNIPNVFCGCIYILAKNVGKTQSLTNWNTAFKNNPYWGASSETNRQSLVDTLLTYSYDRATAGYATCTIVLHANTLARLTAEEIAAITAKGFTLTA